ncbi:MAG: hypothetical protein C0483_22970 [Pirellula sp.]|nr:hypothetical protein [Pirellula sp.]
MNGYRTTIAIVATWLGAAGFGIAEGRGAEPVDFERQILPLLYNRCFSCHSEKQAEPKAGLLLDSAEGLKADGVINVAKPDESEMLIRVSLPHSDESLMPPLKGGGQPLNEAERALLRRWIAEGAQTQDWRRFDHREPAVEYDRKPLGRTEVPRLAREMDAIVQKFHRANEGAKDGADQSSLNPAIDDATFVRRIYLDVVGRIPSYEESQTFLEDTSPDKRARLIDRLLASEGYVSHMFQWKADQLRVLTRGFPGQPGYKYDEWVKESIRSGMAYDEFVRRLVTADGYLWENGAVGFYQRDLGMPFDHMSNMVRIFLGTRLECAQCHDHPFEPITQADFYQLTAYTYGVSNLYSAAGYSTDNVPQWPELQKKLDAMDAPKGLRDFVSVTVAPLKRLTKDTPHGLKYPDHAPTAETRRGKPVDCRTPFGDEAPATVDNRREVLAAWMTSPRNPRFTRNIVNRLFRRVMGIGLIEPVDSLSPVNRPQQAELLNYLTQTMADLRYDERALLAVLLNSKLYQSECDREEPEPGEPFAMRGPLLRRLSAEQIWDSLLTLLVEGLDERKPRFNDRGMLEGSYLERLTKMSASEVLDRSKVVMEHHAARRAHSLELEQQRIALKQARDSGDKEAYAKLHKQFALVNDAFERYSLSLGMGGGEAPKETDRRWAGLPPSWLRAAELPTPVALGHFLRQFGQSDRREIDAFNKNPNITHSLAMMNGELTEAIVDEHSYLRAGLRNLDEGERIAVIYQAILVRRPTSDELAHVKQLFAESGTPEADLIWALVNSPEFLFLQ